MEPLDDMVLELVPHCESTSPRGWTGDHDLRPLTETGGAQAQALVPALGTDIAAIYSSPALRCIQTVGPLAEVLGLPIAEYSSPAGIRGSAWSPARTAT